MANYPTSLDDGTTLPEPTTGATIPASADTNRSQAIKELEAKVGIGASNAASATANHILVADGAGSSSWTDVPGLATKAGVSSGIGAPSSTPSSVGDIHVDLTNDLIYIATATSSSADWDLITDTDAVQTLTNKTIDGDNNTISNLDLGNEVDWAAIGDVTDRTAFASGDKILIYEAGVGMRKIDYDDLPGAGGGLSNVVEDITPQLGGNLDVNGNTITSAAGGDITIAPDGAGKLNLDAGAGTVEITTTSGNSNIILDPHGTGDVQVGNFTFDADQTVGAGQDNYVLTYDNTGGKISLEAAAGGISDVVDDTTPQLGGSLDVNGNKIVSVSNGDIDIEPNGTGNVLLGNLTFDADQTVGAGQDNYVLTYDNAAGTIGLEAAAGGGGSTAKEYAIATLITTDTDLTSGVFEQGSNGTGATYTAPASSSTAYAHIFSASESFAADTWCGVNSKGAYNLSSAMNNWDTNQQIKAFFRSVQGNDRCEMIIGAFDREIDFSNDIPFTKTMEHFCIYREGDASSTTWYASNANGTTQTTTDISSNFTDGQQHTIRIDYEAGTDIKFYVDGTLAATHTTNMPTGASANYASFTVGLGNTGSQAGGKNYLYLTSAQHSFEC